MTTINALADGAEGPTLGITRDPATGLVSGIYRISCMTNGKVYVGSAVNVAGRWGGHLRDLAKNRHRSRYLQNAWNKYGPAAFVFEVIEWVEVPRLIEREQYHIDTTRAAFRSHGFNICPTAGSMLGVIHGAEARRNMSKAHIGKTNSEETRKKLSEALTGRVFSATHRQRMSEAIRGKKHSEETLRKLRARRPTEESRRKMSEANIGKTISAAHRQKLREANVGKKLSEEHKQKIGAAHAGRKLSEEHKQKLRGRKMSEETKRKISAANTGRKLSEETRRNISAAMTGRKLSEETRRRMCAAQRNRALARLGVDVTRPGAAGTLCTGQDGSTFEETTAMGDKIVWTHKDMVDATIEHWGIDGITRRDCRVVAGEDDNGRPCLIVIHKATGRTSTEAGDRGRWHLDGTAYGD